MEFDLVLRKRRNVYGFQDRPIPEVVLSRILENARHVPSAGFTQDFDLVVVRDPVKRAKLAEAARQNEYASYGGVVAEVVEKAPVVVVPCGTQSRDRKSTRL